MPKRDRFFFSLQVIKYGTGIGTVYDYVIIIIVINTVQIEIVVGACCDFQGLIQVSWEGTL
jgi:hypothetical protein